MTTVAAFVLVLGVVVVVHELGHFLAARAHGVRVETFSVGFGPKLLKWRRGPTLFCLSAIPIGGYVRLAGAGLFAEGTGADQLRSKSRWARAQIYVAGPLANIGLAVVLGTIAYMFGPPPDLFESGQGVVERVQPGGPADRAGFKPGDRLLGANMSCDCTLADVRYAFDASDSTTVEIEVLRDGRTRLVPLTREQGSPAPFDRLGWTLRVEPMSGSAPDSSIASRAPVEPGASRRTVIGAAHAVSAEIAAAFAAVPAEVRDAIQDRQPERLIVGPIGIARLCGQAAQSGWWALLALASAVSLGLAFTNLLPIPVADGGQICILLAEAVCRRDAGIRTRTALMLAGIVMLIGLLGIATWFDLRAMF